MSELNEAQYARVVSQMVGMDDLLLRYPPAICELANTPGEHEYRIDREETSFTRQMAAVLQAPLQPSSIAFTVRSAIPVADSVRGVYEGLGLDCPQLIAVNPKYGYYLERDYDPDEAELAETERLRQLVAGQKRALVLDQFVISGRSLNRAGLLLYAAGVQSVGAIRGKWYEQAYPSKDEELTVTSKHATQMHAIGLTAAHNIQIANNNAITVDHDNN